jgi:hypothetical protein
VIHHGQGLSFGFKTGDHAFGVHPEFDHFQCHATAHRFLLFSHINHTAAPLTY